MSAGAAGGAASPGGGGGGVSASSMNPFYQVTNLFSQPNKQGLITSQILGAAQIPGGGNVNPGNFLRGIRLMVRTVTPGTIGSGVVFADWPFNIFANLGLLNVDGSEII